MIDVVDAGEVVVEVSCADDTDVTPLVGDVDSAVVVVMGVVVPSLVVVGHACSLMTSVLVKLRAGGVGLANVH